MVHRRLPSVDPLVAGGHERGDKRRLWADGLVFDCSFRLDRDDSSIERQTSAAAPNVWANISKPALVDADKNVVEHKHTPSGRWSFPKRSVGPLDPVRSAAENVPQRMFGNPCRQLAT